MSNILGIHTLELKPDVTVEEFETFAANEVPSYVQDTPGYSQRVYKGVKGQRVDKYILLFHIEGDEARKRFFLHESEREAFYAQLNKKYPENSRIPDTLKTLVNGFTTNFTDYDLIGSTTWTESDQSRYQPKAIGIHTLELKPNVTPEQLEDCASNDLKDFACGLPLNPCRLYKGIKGGRENQYMLATVWEHQASYEFYLKTDEDKKSVHAKMNQENPQNSRVVQQLNSLVNGFGTNFTDYVAVN